MNCSKQFIIWSMLSVAMAMVVVYNAILLDPPKAKDILKTKVRVYYLKATLLLPVTEFVGVIHTFSISL